ncbi:putative divalent heavy-metal cations transporter [Thioflavicoccus mobilis 8321]|uniref:Putative divalent heavy-metal cations transporter n=1 Tax=Thioflavicoccus mobilis 8321 TaxID=765912 RepID=L0GU54_9GAMM|nr:ZIP family metal transporter [Thioflavicoccus mobilis]AGA89347.1 putative divalent heavy-metal cations transporter [Thioflavicoccus mobilis 8321]
MEIANRSLIPNLRAAWIDQARTHPWTTAGLALAALAILLMLATSIWQVVTGEATAPLRLAMLGGVAAFGTTALGAVPAFGLHGINQRLEDSMLGMAAGMMLAASSFSLILPGLDAGEAMTGSGTLAALTVVAGMGLGVLLMLGLDQFTPHQHAEGGTHGAGAARVSRLWLFVFAIALHNLPEGMAIGVSFSQGDMSVGLPLTTAIALQDIPEGLAVAMALRAIGLPAWRAVALAAATGLMEPLGALLGVGLSSGLALTYPIGLGLAAGAMIFVVSHEVIPETHRNGHQTPATLGLMAGFALMMVLDTALG